MDGGQRDTPILMSSTDFIGLIEPPGRFGAGIQPRSRSLTTPSERQGFTLGFLDAEPDECDQHGPTNSLTWSSKENRLVS